MSIKQCKLLLFAVLMITIYDANAQVLKREGKLRPKYSYNNQEISYEETLEILKSNEASQPLVDNINKYDLRKDISLGVFITSPFLTMAFPGNDNFNPDWIFIGMTVAGLAAYYLYAIRWTREIGNAIELFNNNQLESRLFLNPNGIGMQLRF